MSIEAKNFSNDDRFVNGSSMKDDFVSESNVAFSENNYLSDFANELKAEQKFVDEAYGLLDFLKNLYRSQQRLVHEKGARGTHQERTERDAFSSHYGDEASRLEQIHDKLVFGKLYMANGNVHYIGRVGLRSHESNEQVLVDWRSKAAMPFYQATNVDPKGACVRRHINTSGKKVVNFEDEILDDCGLDDSFFKADSKNSVINTSNSVLVGKNSLLNALSSARTDYMSDIVSTIQKEQDDIIRSDCSQVLLVQGGPGTGKTAVALHRGAFVLYEDRKRLKNNGVLIIGPSKVFLKYVENVLPSLGETGVMSSTISTLRSDMTPSFVDSPDIAVIKGDLYWKQICENAVKYLRKVPDRNQTIRVDSVDLVITPAEVRKSMDKALHSHLPHNEARVIFVQSMLDKLTSKYEASFLDNYVDSGENAWIRESIRTNFAVQRALNLCWLPCDAKTLLHWLYKHPVLLDRCAPDFDSHTRKALFFVDRVFSDNDVAIVDFLDRLLGPIVSSLDSDKSNGSTTHLLSKAKEAISSQGLGNGIVNASMLVESGERNFKQSFDVSEAMLFDPNWTFGHIIVDEAQELSPMQWLMLTSRCPSHSFTIVGDLDQSRHAGRVSNWVDLLNPIFKTEIVEKVLTISYRTPKEIMDKAISVMDFLGSRVKYPVSCVRNIDGSYVSSKVSFSCVSDVLEVLAGTVVDYSSRMDEEYGVGLGKLAVVFSREDFMVYGELLSDFLVNKMTIFPKNRIVITEASHTKGLEYDYVVLVNPDSIAQDSVGDLYVGLTRATKNLHVFCGEGSALPL